MYEMIVGLQIKDDKVYSKYREAMGPILLKFEGGFRYDFKVSEVLKNEENRAINRVFAIYFANENAMNEFFNNEEYLKVKKTFFEASVAETTIISQYSRA